MFKSLPFIYDHETGIGVVFTAITDGNGEFVHGSIGFEGIHEGGTLLVFLNSDGTYEISDKRKDQ